jgi:hypothetical protein
MNRRIGIWLAILGMTLNALWPLLANAGPKEILAIVCSVSGARSAAAADGGTPLPHQSPVKIAVPHCPFCLGGGDQTPGLTTSQAVAYQPQLSELSSIPSETPAWAFFAHPSSHPRGPPPHLI